jgi:hypothetical protein
MAINQACSGVWSNISLNSAHNALVVAFSEHIMQEGGLIMVSTDASNNCIVDLA